MNIWAYLSIGWHLLRRELLVLRSSLRAGLIDATVMSAVAILTFGYFLPEMGMPPSFRLPLFIGSLLVSVLFFGYHAGGALAVDLATRKVTHYHAALPIPIWMVLLVQLVAMTLRILTFVVPAGAIGIWILYDPAIVGVSIGGALAIALLVSTFFAEVFLCAVMYFSPDRFYTDLWPCILAPMYSFGCIFFTWQSLYRLRPLLAQAMLINPMTFCTEGLRAALLGGMQTIPLSVCISALTGWCLALFAVYWVVAVRRLNPAVPRRGV